MIPRDAADSKTRPQNLNLDPFILTVDSMLIGPFRPLGANHRGVRPMISMGVLAQFSLFGLKGCGIALFVPMPFHS